MRQPNFVTFTGLDAHTDLDRVVALSQRYDIEWGVLFSPKQQGIHPRYPDAQTVAAITAIAAANPSIMLAAHLCGQHGRDIMEAILPPLDLTPFGRIQINHPDPDLIAISMFRKAVQDHAHGIIVQVRGAFPAFYPVSWLYDPSGGRGIGQTEWPFHGHANEIVGYAGGITPETAGDIVRHIGGRAGQSDYWIDMESGVRDADDHLDLDKCEAVLKAVYG